MSEIVRDQAVVAGSPEAIWAILEDPEALARILPGMETLTFDGPGRFRGVIAARVQLFTVRVDVTGALVDPEPFERIRLTLEGRPRGLGGAIHLSVPMAFTALDPASTRIDYTVDLESAGQLAALGDRVIRDSMRDLIVSLVANLDRELARRGPGEDPGSA